MDELLEKCRKRQERDPRVELKLYEDLEAGPVTVHAFYVRFLLPIWFDVQVIENAPGSEPAPALALRLGSVPARRRQDEAPDDPPVAVDSAGVYEDLSPEDLGYGDLPRVEDD